LPGSISSSEVFRDRCANGEVPCCRAPEGTNSVILLWKIQLIFKKVGGPLGRSCGGARLTRYDNRHRADLGEEQGHGVAAAHLVAEG
jgi:hypothetical protein